MLKALFYIYILDTIYVNSCSVCVCVWARARARANFNNKIEKKKKNKFSTDQHYLLECASSEQNDFSPDFGIFISNNPLILK